LAGSGCFWHMLLTQTPTPHTSSSILQSAATLHPMPPLLEVLAEDAFEDDEEFMAAPPPAPPVPPGFT
jgi:hypothetical protein